MLRRWAPTIYTFLVAGAITVKFDASLQIGGTCDHAQAAYAVKVSVVATGSCSEDGRTLTVAYEAVNTRHIGGPTAADKHSRRLGQAGRKALDRSKNLLSSETRKCV